MNKRPMDDLQIRDENDPILTTRETARLLGIAVSTAQLWIESGALQSWKTPGGHRRVRLSSVQRLLEDRATKGGQSKVELAAVPASSEEFLPLAQPPYPVPDDERERLLEVDALGLLDTESDEVFDRLTWLASEMTSTPVALITLLTSRRQWFKSKVGTTISETPREVAFCTHAIMGPDPLVVSDATLDPRFQNNSLVTGEPHIRFYAGYPLIGRNGHRVGTLCVIDVEPRRLREKEMRALRELAHIASDELKRKS